MSHIRTAFQSGEMQKLNRRHLSEEDKDVYYLPEILTGGAPCDDERDDGVTAAGGDTATTGRTTLVRWACAQDGKERLLVSDVRRFQDGCAAEMVGFTRSLCGDPRFAPLKNDGKAGGAGGDEGEVDANQQATFRNFYKEFVEGKGGGDEEASDDDGGGGGGGVDANLADGGGDFKRGHSAEMLASGRVITELRRLRWGHGYCGERTADLPALDPAAAAAKAAAASRGCLGGGAAGEQQQCSAGDDASAVDGGWEYFGPVKPFPPIRRRVELGGLLESENMKVGAEIGVLGGNFAAHLLRRWHGCERYLMVDPWLHQDTAEYTLNKYQNEELMNRALEAVRRCELISILTHVWLDWRA